MDAGSDTWLGTVEAAALLGCSDDTVLRMFEEGLFPNARRNRRSSPVRIPKSDVDAHIERTKPKVLRRTRAA